MQKGMTGVNQQIKAERRGCQAKECALAELDTTCIHFNDPRAARVSKGVTR